MTHPQDQREIVLLVDDSPDTLSMLTNALEEAGLTVLVARDGQTALMLVERVQPDLVLLDAVMPGIDGFETCRRLKKDPRLAATPVIFMTGLSESADVVRGLAAGGVDYVTKPVDCDALIARIAVHVANARTVMEARLALDFAGRAVLALDSDGTIRWASPKAADFAAPVLERLMEKSEDPCENRSRTDTRNRLVEWLTAAVERPLSDWRPHQVVGREEGGIELTYLSKTPNGVHLVRSAQISTDPPGARLSEKLGLTPREGEVLAWVADGKASRDIATILGLSPRTVTKHLEQIYAKLGVENRTSAVALALRTLES